MMWTKWSVVRRRCCLMKPNGCWLLNDWQSKEGAVNWVFARFMKPTPDTKLRAQLVKISSTVWHSVLIIYLSTSHHHITSAVCLFVWTEVNLGEGDHGLVTNRVCIDAIVSARAQNKKFARICTHAQSNALSGTCLFFLVVSLLTCRLSVTTFPQTVNIRTCNADDTKTCLEFFLSYRTI